MSKIRIFECISLPGANQYLPEPFKLKEKVLFVSDIENENRPETYNRQFIKIKRISSKTEIVEFRKHFQEILPKK